MQLLNLNILLQEWVHWPNDMSAVVTKFYEIGQIPLVIACIDRILIKLEAPHENEPDFVDRHGKYSINSMMVWCPGYRFLLSMHLSLEGL